VGAAVDVEEWLRSQNLGKYEEAFRENAIDLDVLADLTDGDLAQIGVALGDRKRLLKAIASFPPSEPIAPAEASAPRPQSAEPANPAPVSSAERRPITVMFRDLVGSTALAAKLDAERSGSTFRPASVGQFGPMSSLSPTDHHECGAPR
jgi:hypothetical protein